MILSPLRFLRFLLFRKRGQGGKRGGGNGAGRERFQAGTGHHRRQMCNSVTMCNGSKSHNPFSINMCNGVTGVPHLTGLPPMTRMGSPIGQGSYSSFQPIRAIRGNRASVRQGGIPPLPRVLAAAASTLGKDPKFRTPMVVRIKWPRRIEG